MIKLKNLLQMISYQENLDKEGFILKEGPDDANDPGHRRAESRDESAGGETGGDNQGDREKGGVGQDETRGREKQGRDNTRDKGGKEGPKVDENGKPGGRRETKRPLRPGEIKARTGRKSADSDGQCLDCGAISASLAENKILIKEFYGLPENKDLVIREFVLGTSPLVKGFAVFLDGMTDKAVQNMLFQALMLFSVDRTPMDSGTLAKHVKERLLPGNQVAEHATFREVMDAVNYGDTAIFWEGCNKAVSVETKGWSHRGVERPVNEQIIMGSQEAFTETMRINTSLIRKCLQNENLTTEFTQVGTRCRSDVAIMYLRDLVNPSLVEEVKRRIKSLKMDYMASMGVLEQLIEDHPYSINPQVLLTERPDRVAAALAEGRVAVMVDNNPQVLVVPITMYDLLHTGEETYLRWQYGTFIRYVRTFAFYVSFLLPGFYLAVVLFHHEMIPTELLFSIAGSREAVPFPSIMEVLMMEVAFELIRESSLRLPGVMGSTIGIVGALILGQAAVQANIVSPILVILVAVTGLANFAIPSYPMSFSLRIYRFFYIFLGASLGFFGITLGLGAQIMLLANMKSFGVPYLSPSGPRTESSTDVVTRLPIFMQEKRPDYLNPRDITAQPNVLRKWIFDRRGGGK